MVQDSTTYVLLLQKTRWISAMLTIIQGVAYMIVLLGYNRYKKTLLGLTCRVKHRASEIWEHEVLEMYTSSIPQRFYQKIWLPKRVKFQ